MRRIGLALLLLTAAPAMAQVAAGTAPALGGSGNQPAPDVSSTTASTVTPTTTRPATAKHPVRRSATHSSRTAQ